MDRNYSITIEVNGLSGNEESPVAGDNKQSDTKKSKGVLSKEGAKAFAKGMVAYQTVKSFATQVINHEVSLVSLRTGSNELQERANFINENVQTAVGIAEGAIAGYMVGGLPGMLIGTALSIGHKVMSIQQKQHTLNLQRDIENETISRNFIRAGAKGYRSNE